MTLICCPIALPIWFCVVCVCVMFHIKRKIKDKVNYFIQFRVNLLTENIKTRLYSSEFSMQKRKSNYKKFF